MNRLRIRISSLNGQVQYQVCKKTPCCWVVLRSFGTRREAKYWIEARSGSEAWW